MVIQLDLSKTFGQQNEDVSKKNKYNSVVLDVISNVDSGDATEGIVVNLTPTSSGNTEFSKAVIKEGNWKRGSWVWEKCTVRNPVFKAVIDYKTYSVTLNKSEYPQFSYLSQIPSFSSTFNGTLRREKSSQHVTLNTNGFNAFKEYFIDKTLTSPMFSGISPTIENYNFTDDIYTVSVPDDPSTEEVETSEDKNIMNEISSFTQSAISNTQNSIKDIFEYINPKITRVSNSSTTVTFTIQSPYKIRTYQSTDCGCLDKTWAEDKFYGEVNSYTYNEYTISSVNLNMFVSVNTETNERKFGDGNREYSAEQSYMFNDTNYMYYNRSKQYAEWFSEGIKESYQNGKMVLNIKYPIGKIKDPTGGNIVYIDGYGIAREVDGNYFGRDGEQVYVESGTKVSYNVPLEAGLLCEIVNNGELVYTKSWNKPKYFLIQDVNFDYSGVALNEITAIESESEPSHYVIVYDQPEHSKIWAENGYQGVIPSGGIIKANYVEIFAKFDKGWGLVDNKMNINGQDKVGQILGLDYGWQVFQTSDVIVKPKVVYLGGKYVYYTSDEGGVVYVNPSVINVNTLETVSGIEDGGEIFTNDYLMIAGNIYGGYRGTLRINGVEQTLSKYGQYDFHINYKVTNSDVNIALTTEDMRRTMSVSVDSGVNFYAKRFSSEYNSKVANTELNDGSTVCVGDVILLDFSAKTGYKSVRYTMTGLTYAGYDSGTGKSKYTVTDNVVLVMETEQDISQFERKLYSYQIVQYTNMANVYTVRRISSNYDVPLSYLSTNSTETDIANHRYFYKAYVGDVLEIKVRGTTGYGVTAVWAGPLGGGLSRIVSISNSPHEYTFQYTVTDTSAVEFKVDAQNMGKSITISNTTGASLSVYRSSSEYAYSGSISNGSMVYPDDILTATFGMVSGSSSIRTSGLDYVSQSASSYTYKVQKNPANGISITYSK